MIEYKNIENGIIVDCSTYHFGPFSVVVFLESNPDDLEEEYTFYLRHKKYCVMKYMFTMKAYDINAAAEIAYANAPEYIPDFIKECFAENE